jgi:RNA-dependent RNA polymerase
VHRLLEVNTLTSRFLPVAPQKEGEGTTLTDGCGLMNGAALTLIARRLGLPSRPIAVQGRVAGSKGLWILHGEDRSPTEPPRIWIRDSQRKVKLPRLEAGSAHAIFDLVSQSTRITVPAHLNYQLIINLAENGVDSEVFLELMRAGLTEVFTSLTQWDGPGAMPLLWDTINIMGSVTRTRLQKIAHGLARAIGLANRFEMDREDDGDDPEEEDSLDSNDNEKSLYETVLALIQAGFDPKSFPILKEKMKYVVENSVKRHLRGYHIGVPQSAGAFIVPGAYINHNIRRAY